MERGSRDGRHGDDGLWHSLVERRCRDRRYHQRWSVGRQFLRSVLLPILFTLLWFDVVSQCGRLLSVAKPLASPLGQSCRLGWCGPCISLAVAIGIQPGNLTSLERCFAYVNRSSRWYRAQFERIKSRHSRSPRRKRYA